jgi:hypothetical protein
MFKSLENLEKITAHSIMELLHYDNTEINQLKLVETLPNADSPPTKNVFVLNAKNPHWYVNYIFEFSAKFSLKKNYLISNFMFL